MADLDIVIRNGTVATAADVVHCDVGIRDGRVVALADKLSAGDREFDASGKFVLPGGIDSHCHIEQLSSSGVVCADDFYSGSVSAAFGGTTTIIPFAAQHHGQSLREVVKDYHACADPKAVIDYAFHLIISDPSEQVLGQELPALIEDGYSSFKVYMTYDLLRLDDHQMLQVFEVARRHGAMVMVHAENHDMIRWLTDRLLGGGYRQPRYHAVSHPRVGEGEATHRAICLAELVDVPTLIVHVSTGEAIDEIRRAQNRGLKIYGETCPQYLFLTAADLDLPGAEGAMMCCSPPPRDETAHAAVWQGLANGTFQVFSSDHAPYRHDETGKLASGPDPSFHQIATASPVSSYACRCCSPPACRAGASISTSSWRSLPPMRRSSTACIRARGPLPWVPTPTSPSGIQRGSSPSSTSCCTITWATRPTQGRKSGAGRKRY